MRSTRGVVAVVLLLVGLVWIGQGVGLIEGSFMSRDPLWAVIGAACVAGAAAIVLLGRRGAR